MTNDQSASGKRRTMKIPTHRLLLLPTTFFFHTFLFLVMNVFMTMFMSMFKHQAHIIIIWIKIPAGPLANGDHHVFAWLNTVPESRSRRKSMCNLCPPKTNIHIHIYISFLFCAWKSLWFFLTLPICHKKREKGKNASTMVVSECHVV